MQVSVVIPTINSSQRIEKNVKVVEEIMKRKGYEYEIIIVTQTSNDNTKAIVEHMSLNSNKIVGSFLKERGKGGALSFGIEMARYPWILMIDDDLSYDIDDFLNRAFNTGSIETSEIRIGSRYVEKLKQSSPFSRKIASLGYRTLVKVLFKIPQKDTQAGIKLIKKDIFDRIGYPEQKGFVWDTELLYRANRHNIKIKEIPMQFKHEPNQLRIAGTVFPMFMGLIKLKFKNINQKD